MKAIPYWVQRADRAMEEFGAVHVADGVRAFETYDWRHELERYRELERAGAECCPSGIGFVDRGGDILHICPNDDGASIVHYHFSPSRKLLGLVPVPRLKVETRQEIHRSIVLELIGFFFDGRRDSILTALEVAHH